MGISRRALIFWRRSDDRMALLTSLFLVTFGTVTVDPAAAIQQNLRAFGTGVEAELNALALSDTLGDTAQAWNRLLAELTEAQRQLQTVQLGGGRAGVLERFEGAMFRRIVDRLPLGVLCIGSNRAITYANAAAAMTT